MCVCVCASSCASRRCDVGAAHLLPDELKSENKNYTCKKKKKKKKRKEGEGLRGAERCVQMAVAHENLH